MYKNLLSSKTKQKSLLTSLVAEEISDAGLVVPRSMVWSFFLNIPMTFGLLITYLFCIGDISDAVSSPTGYPFIYVFQTATGSAAGTTGLTVVILLLLIVITISSYASTSRQLFAFARDNGMPFSKWLARVGACPPMKPDKMSNLARCIHVGKFRATPSS